MLDFISILSTWTKAGTKETAKQMLDFWKKDSLFQAIQSFLGTDFSANVSKLENFLRINSTYDVRVPEFY